MGKINNEIAVTEKHINNVNSNIEKGDLIFDVEIIKHYAGDLVNDYSFQFSLESDPTSALLFLMYVEVCQVAENNKANDLIELKSFINQFISHAHFLEKKDFYKADNIIYKLIGQFQKIYFELRQERVFFLQKLILLIDKDLSKIYTKEPQIFIDSKPSIFETKNVWGLYLAIQKKVGILPNNNTLLGNQIAPIINVNCVKLSQAITSEKKYRNHDINIDDLEIIEDAIDAMSKEIQKLKQSKM